MAGRGGRCKGKLVVLSLVLSATCLLPIYAKNEELREDAVKGLLNEELLALQYYSNGFDLVRIAANTNDRSTSGKLITKQGVVYEIIRFKKGTPGVATRVSPDRKTIWVSFEEGCEIEYSTDKNTLRLRSNNITNPFFVLHAPLVQGKDKVRYCGRDYWTSIDYKYPNVIDLDDPLICVALTERGQDACFDRVFEAFALVVDQNNVRRSTRDSRVAPGRRVGSK